MQQKNQFVGLCLTIVCMSVSDRHRLQGMNHAASYHDITSILHSLLQIYPGHDRHQIFKNQNRPGFKEDVSYMYMTKTCRSFFALRCSYFTTINLKFFSTQHISKKILTTATQTIMFPEHLGYTEA